jgi:two-component sensor histidine kinase
MEYPLMIRTPIRCTLKSQNDAFDFVSEANHRLANNLTAIAAAVRLQSRSEARVLRLRSPKEVSQLLEEVAVRIEATARLHRLLTEVSEDGQLDLRGYFLTIVNVVLKSHWMDRVSLNHDIDPSCHLPRDAALPVAMIITELMTNSLKYAHPTGVEGQIDLQCHPVDGGVLIEVNDDGVGFPEGFDPQAASSVGFRLIHGLCGQIGARLSFTQLGIGLHAELFVPIQGRDAGGPLAGNNSG